MRFVRRQLKLALANILFLGGTKKAPVMTTGAYVLQWVKTWDYSRT